MRGLLRGVEVTVFSVLALVAVASAGDDCLRAQTGGSASIGVGPLQVKVDALPKPGQFQLQVDVDGDGEQEFELRPGFISNQRSYAVHTDLDGLRFSKISLFRERELGGEELLTVTRTSRTSFVIGIGAADACVTTVGLSWRGGPQVQVSATGGEGARQAALRL